MLGYCGWAGGGGGVNVCGGCCCCSLGTVDLTSFSLRLGFFLSPMIGLSVNILCSDGVLEMMFQLLRMMFLMGHRNIL